MLAQMLGPLAPHLAEELWLAFGHDGARRTDAVAGRIVAVSGMSTQTAPRARAGLQTADALLRDRPRLPPL